MNKFCTSCGDEIGLGKRFCERCGQAVQLSEVENGSSALPPSTMTAGKTLPSPPSWHWAVVLLLSIFTLGLFAWAWAFVQAIFVKRLTGTWKPLVWLLVPASALVVGLIRDPNATVPAAIGWLFVFGVFSMRYHVLKHYNFTEPISLKLGFWQTLLGSIFYVQCHFNRIAQLKRDQPQLFAPYAASFPVPDETSNRFWLRFAAVAAVVGVLVFGVIYIGGAKSGNAAEPTAKTQTTPALASNPDSPTASTEVLDVSVDISPEARDWLESIALTEGPIKNLVQQGLANRRIVSIPDNAVVEGLGDSAYVQFSEEPAEGGSKIHVELSVRNGASANNRFVRWQETATIEALGDPMDLPKTLNKLMDDLQAAFNSPAYKTGRRNDVSQ